MVDFKGGQTENLREEFEERKEYKEYEGFKLFRTIDTHYKNFKYGMMNRKYEPITIIAEQAEEGLQSFPELAEDVKVLPFVAEAFNDFRKEYTSFVNNSSAPKINYPKYIEALTPVRGYMNTNQEFAGYVNYNMDSHKKQLGIDPEIKTYDIFLEKFFEIFEERGEEYPITKSGFITSEHCSIMTSGLCIELAQKDYDIDAPKGEMITTSDFHCFADYANYYGFLIDKYVPWRLVADLKSERMRGYIVSGKELRTSRAMDLYESVYTVRSCYDDLYLLRNYLFGIYYTIYRNNQDAVQPIPPVAISQHVSTLLKVRCIELGIYDEKFGALEQKVLDIFSHYGLRYTQGYIGHMASERLKDIYGS